MENEIRLVLLVIGAIIILAILWDGLRRQRRDREQLQKTKATAANIEPKMVLREILELDEESVPATVAAGGGVETIFASNAWQAVKQETVVKHELSAVEEPVREVITTAATITTIEPIMAVEEKAPASLPTIIAVIEPAQAPVEPVVVMTTTAATKRQNQLIMFTVVAAGEKLFGGFSLLQSLLNRGFRFGEDKIFHYHQGGEPQGKQLFSLAAATNTGEFELSKMASFTCKGLVIFMNSRDHGLDSAEIFGEMVEVTEALAKDLNNAELRIGQSAAWEEAHLARLHKNLVDAIE